MMMLAVSDLSATVPMPPAISPSKNTCKVRVSGTTRYRNDPYNCLVLPPITSQLPAAAPQQPPSSTRRNLLDPLQSQPGRHASRVKAEVMRASTVFAAPQPIANVEEHSSVAAERTTPNATPNIQYVFVAFKFDTCVYQSEFPVNVGDQVVVEGDRGTNMGVISSVLAARPQHNVPCRVVRIADERDRYLNRMQRERENGARALAEELVQQFRMDISIVDTEFQTDGAKLTVYFASNRAIDFRRLQRALFRQYHCRIWLVNWNELPQHVKDNHANA